MLEVVTFRWKPAPGYRSKFGPETVNVLARMVRRHYRGAHRFTVITDDPTGIDADVRVIPLWPDHADLLSPHGPLNPSCYRRLKLFSEEMRMLIGERIVCLDLDCVLTGDVGPLWNRPDDFVIWGDTNPTTPYNGSMLLMTAGSRRQVWEQFHPINSPVFAKRRGYFGSDQAWIGYCLGPNEKTWRVDDGVYSFRNHLVSGHRTGALPRNAKIVIFHGKFDPWDANVQHNYPWIKDHYK